MATDPVLSFGSVTADCSVLGLEVVTVSGSSTVVLDLAFGVTVVRYTGLALCESICVCVCADVCMCMVVVWPWLCICVCVRICVCPYRCSEIGMIVSPYIQKVNQRTDGRRGSVGYLKETVGSTRGQRKRWNLTPDMGDLGLAKNYRGITLTSIATKIYNALLRNCIEPKIDNILRKNQNGFRRNRSTTSQILTIRRILEGVRAKNTQAKLLFVDFTKAFDSIHRGKMEQILLAYGLPKETVAAITILYRDTKVKVRDTEYFDIVPGVLQGDTLAPYLFIICLGDDGYCFAVSKLSGPIEIVAMDFVELWTYRAVAMTLPCQSCTDVSGGR